MTKDEELIERHEPDAWVWVPRNPTPEMLAASEREWDGRMSFRSTGAWQAMIDAAPVSPNYSAGEPTPGDPSPAREADDHLSPTEFTSSLADRGETSATLEALAQPVVGEIKRLPNQPGRCSGCGLPSANCDCPKPAALAASPSPVVGDREAIGRVECIETVPIDHPFSDEATPPIWRVIVGEYCADFDYEQAARNFAGAINESILSLSTPVVGGVCISPNRSER